jgi:hypothetical protein
MASRTRMFLQLVLLVCVAVPSMHAQQGTDLDNYRWRVQGNWWFSHPSGYFGTNNSDNYFNIDHDFGFGDYSTFAGKVDWRFGRKHHLLFAVSSFNNSKTATLTRTIDFQGQEFVIGAQVDSTLKSLVFAPGYQYDIIRGDHGFLGLEVDFNLLDTEATLKLAGTANGQSGSTSASKSFLAPLPSVGPVGRWYPLHDSNRLSLEGSLTGMSFFGYGNFLRGHADVNLGVTSHMTLKAGYAMGSRLSIHGTFDEIALQLTQKGPTAGLEFSWGEAPAKKNEAVSNQPGNWHVTWIPAYLWFSGLQGRIGVHGNSAPVDVSFTDVISQLNIGWLTALDMRRNRIGLVTDLAFISVSSDQKSTPVGSSYTGFSSNAKTFFLDSEAYVRLLEGDRGAVDVLAGARLWRLNNSLNLLSATQPPVTVGQTQGWVDPIFGARFRLNLKKGWFADLKGDAGGFGVGSQSTWQIYAGAGREFKQRYSLALGYRRLNVDYRNRGFLYDTHMQGLLTGFAIRFK